MIREIEFASHPGNMALMRDFVRKFLSEFDFPDGEKEIMVLGLDEACTNVIRYAYEHACSQPMSLSCERLGDGIVFRLRDYGKPCPPEQLRGRELDKVRPGGLGVHLIRRAFDGVEYIPKEDGTELMLTRYFQRPPQPKTDE